MGLGLDSPDAHIDYLATVADALKPELTAS